jgi:hypothetical protein
MVDCGERMLRMLQIAQRRLQVLSDPRARLLSHTDAPALVICSDNRRIDVERCSSMRRTRSPYCVRATIGHSAALRAHNELPPPHRLYLLPLHRQPIPAEDAWEPATSLHEPRGLCRCAAIELSLGPNRPSPPRAWPPFLCQLHPNHAELAGYSALIPAALMIGHYFRFRLSAKQGVGWSRGKSPE